MEDRNTEQPDTTAPSRNLMEFLDWVANRPRSYEETMEAWRTSCPRLSVWEDATSDDLVRVDHVGAACQGQAVVQLTDRGAALLGRSKSASLP